MMKEDWLLALVIAFSLHDSLQAQKTGNSSEMLCLYGILTPLDTQGFDFFY